jgi:hypothetical protein
MNVVSTVSFNDERGLIEGVKPPVVDLHESVDVPHRPVFQLERSEFGRRPIVRSSDPIRRLDAQATAQSVVAPLEEASDLDHDR